MAFLSRSWSNETSDLSPPKRISTPAGMRLSVIMENGGNLHGRPKRNSIFSSSKASSNTLIEPPGRTSMSASDDLRGGASGYSYSIFAEKPAPSSQGSSKEGGFLRRKGGWKRILILLALLLISIIAIVVGLVVGLKKSNHSSSGNGIPASSTTDGALSGQSSGASSSPSASGTSVEPSSPTSTTISKDFPIGSYSFVTFLGNVETQCTSNTLTWTCFPYFTFNDSPSKALTTFNWEISAGSKPGTYQISSSNNPFAITFSNLPLKLVNQGKANELYTFQLQVQKEVLPSGAITSEGTTAKCFYTDTTFTGYLYTKQAKNYPTTSSGDGNPAFQPWPFSVRAEQVAASGADAPSCYTYTDGNLGARVQGNLTVSDPQMLCSCIYRNYSPT